MGQIRRWVASWVVVGLVLNGAGCMTTPPDNGGGNNEEAPKIPPSSTFVIDFSDFEQNDGGDQVVRTRGVLPFENWGYAAGSVLFWNTVVTVTLAVPVAAFVESFNHEPTLNSQGIWSWEYDVTVNGMNYSAELQGQINGANVNWNMFISKEGDFTDFNWFSGTSNILGSEGSWSLNNDPDDPTPFIDIVYNVNEAAGTGDIRYTNVIPGNADNGGYIFFGLSDDEPFDAAYEIFLPSQNQTTEIEWSRDNKNGRVKNAAHFGDNEYHCWDENLSDIECP